MNLWQALELDRTAELDANTSEVDRQDRDSRKPGGLFPEQTTDSHILHLGRIKAWGPHLKKKGRRQ